MVTLETRDPDHRHEVVSRPALAPATGSNSVR